MRRSWLIKSRCYGMKARTHGCWEFFFSQLSGSSGPWKHSAFGLMVSWFTRPKTHLVGSCFMAWSGGVNIGLVFCHIIMVHIIVCQILPWLMKDSSFLISIWSFVAKVAPLCSVHHAPSYEPNFTLLVSVSTLLDYLGMPFILLQACTTCQCSSSKKYTTCLNKLILIKIMPAKQIWHK